MNHEQYVNDIMRHIRLPKAMKARLREDLENDVQARLEAGLPLEEVAAELGEPKEAARQLAASLPKGYKAARSWVRYLYVVCGAVPCVLGAVLFLRSSILFHDVTGQYPSYSNYLLVNYWRSIVLLLLNVFMQLAVCIMGFLLFRQKWQREDRRLLFMLGACAFVWFLQQPAILGITLLPGLSNTGYIIIGPLQPQCLLTLATGIALYMAHKKGRG